MTDISSTTTDTSAVTDLKSDYPAQYYGEYDTTATDAVTLSRVIDVWNAKDADGNTLSLDGLAAASSLLVLTAAQFALAAGAGNVWVQNGALLYPARYYAGYDSTAAQPTPVTGWFDTWSLISIATLAAASSMVAVSSADWADTAFRLTLGKGVQSGGIVAYTPPAATATLAAQATTALAAARTYVYNNYGILNEATPDAWVAYLKALMAIANGTDTTSTALPTEPAT
ncbi:MAG: hypothetical protein ABF646_09265 [Acetobacter papayae]